MNDDEAGEWMPVQDAAVRLDMTEGAIRSRISRNTLRHRKANDGKLSVFVSDEAVDDRRSFIDEATNILRQERDEARDQAEHWRTQAETAKLDAAVARAEKDAAKAIAAAEVGAKDTLITELRAMLENARRPWWRRWYG